MMYVAIFLLRLPILLLSLGLHEFGHAAMADKLGDPTPRAQGRLTLNPLAHLDPLGTIFILLSMLSGFGLGWGKPVLTNPMYFRHYRRGLLLVALAGPLMNICLAMFGMGLAYVVYKTGAVVPDLLRLFFFLWVTTNLSLATFNLIPIPPLDGGNILASLLPGRLGERYRYFGPYGMLILLGLMYVGAVGFLVWLFIRIDLEIVSFLLGPDFAHWLFASLGL
jgi:Zn-dependent protease